MTRGCANGVVLWDRWQLRRRNRRTVRMKPLHLSCHSNRPSHVTGSTRCVFKRKRMSLSLILFGR